MIYTAVQNLIEYGIRKGLMTKDDTFVVRNTLIDILGLGGWEDSAADNTGDDIDAILAPIVDYACEKARSSSPYSSYS